MNRITGYLVGLALLIVGIPALAATPGAYEKPPQLKASQLLPPDLLQGPRHRVEESVPTDGFMTTFTIHSNFGEFSASSVDLVRTRIHEIAALAELEKLSADEAMSEGFKTAGKELGQEFKQLFTNPEETLTGVSAGIGRFFERTGRAAKTGVQKLGDVRDQDDGPPPPPAGPGVNLPGSTEGAGNAMHGSLAAESAKAVGKVTANFFGYDDQRRALAKGLQVDPYTTNPVLAKKLDEVAWAAFQGGLGVALLKAVAPLTMAVSIASVTADWVWDTPPGDLRVQIEKILLDAGASQDQVDLFLRHPKYSLTFKARYAKALESLKGTADRASVMPLALTVISVGQARFVVESLEMLAAYAGDHGTISKIEVHGTVIGRTQNGAIVVPAAVNHVSWTEGLHRFATRRDLAAADRSILLRGRATPLAKTQLARLGWTTREEFLR